MTEAHHVQLQNALGVLNVVYETLDQAADDEREAVFNLPESMEFSEKAEKMEEYVDALEEAADAVQDAISSLESAVIDVESVIRQEQFLSTL